MHADATFGSRLRQLRKNARLSQAELVALAGIPGGPSVLSMHESGARVPGAHVVGQLARALRADVNFLLTGEAREGPTPQVDPSPRGPAEPADAPLDVPALMRALAELYERATPEARERFLGIAEQLHGAATPARTPRPPVLAPPPPRGVGPERQRAGRAAPARAASAAGGGSPGSEPEGA